MRLFTMVLLAGLATWWLGGCSSKQEEAARLEQELKDMESADSSALDSEAGETAGLSEGESATRSADPSAVPPESGSTAQARRRAAEASKTPMPPAPSGGGYTVQIASCESQDYARHLVGVYTNRGYQPFVSTITYNNQTYYRVRVGNFQSLADARVLRDELIDKFSVKPWIDRVE